MDFNITDTLYKILDGLNAYEGWYREDLNTTHITFFSLLENEADFSEDEAETIEFMVQIDVWTKDSIEANTLKREIKTRLKSNDFTYIDGKDLFENINNEILYHKALRYNYKQNI